MDIRTDSEYVQKGVASWRSWHGSGWAGEHCDLWGLLAEELNSRANPVSVSWVKGHAKMIDVQRGRTTLLDKYGNDGADELAVAGAAQHPVVSLPPGCAPRTPKSFSKHSRNIARKHSTT